MKPEILRIYGLPVGMDCPGLYFALKNKVIFANEENSNFAHILRIPAGEKRVLGSSLSSQ